MNTVRLADLDELVLTVRDRTSRSHIMEAVAAYRGGAYRAAIVAAWIAVAYDVIAKIRELAGQSDANAARFVVELDAAIANRNVPQLQKIESSLLDRARDEFQFLAAHEHEDLVRLKADRDLCAHPALVTEEGLFQPTPELVRAHMVHAVAHLLQHRPVQGKAALARIKADIARDSFPDDEAGARAFLSHKYLDRAKDSLVRNLIVLLTKNLLRGDDPDLQGKEANVIVTLVAVSWINPSMYEQALPGTLRSVAGSLDDDQLWSVFRLIGADQRCWAWLGEDTQLRLRALLDKASTPETVSRAVGAGVFDALPVEDLREDILEFFERLAPNDQQTAIARSPRPEFAAQAVRLFEGARSWRGAEALGHTVLLPMAQCFSAKQIGEILAAVRDNGEIRYAGGMPAILESFFEQTAHLLEETRDAWAQLVTALQEGQEAGDYYTYPELREKLAERA